MGLDITAYRRIKPVERLVPDTEPDYEKDEFRLWHNSDFPTRATDIPQNTIFTAEKEIGFCAGAYSYYNRWRDQLARMVGHDDAEHVWRKLPKSGPFLELINFSDCEGVIGADVSRKLAQDFAAFQEKADQHPDQHFRERYSLFRKAFELAAEDGAVSFH